MAVRLPCQALLLAAWLLGITLAAFFTMWPFGTQQVGVIFVAGFSAMAVLFAHERCTCLTIALILATLMAFYYSMRASEQTSYSIGPFSTPCGQSSCSAAQHVTQPYNPNGYFSGAINPQAINLMQCPIRGCRWADANNLAIIASPGVLNYSNPTPGAYISSRPQDYPNPGIGNADGIYIDSQVRRDRP